MKQKTVIVMESLHNNRRNKLKHINMNLQNLTKHIK